MGCVWLAILALCAHAHTVQEVSSRRQLLQSEDANIYTLHGSGTTNPSKFFWKVMDIMEERAKVPLFMTYRAVGSSTGQKEFTGTSPAFDPLNHFGAGDIPLTQDRYNLITNKGAKLLHIPFLVGPIAVFHSVPAGELPADGIKLDSCLLSKILRRVITTWDDPAIKDLNRDLKVPAGQSIKVVHRNLGSSSTAGITEYLAKATTDSVDDNCKWSEDNKGSNVTWDSATVGVFGSGGMADYLGENDYAIGYLDAGHGHSLNLEEIALQNKAGTYLKSKDANITATLERALANDVLPANATTSFAEVNLYDLPGTDTWPITMMSYFYIRQDLSGLGASGTLLKAFVEFVLSPEGQEMVPEFLFAPLPASVLKQNADALATLRLDNSAPAWTFEGSTTRAMVGADQFALSSKRQSYAEYERSQMNKHIAALETSVSKLSGVKSYQLHGSGTTNPSKFFWKVMDIMEEQAKVPLFMTYRAVGSTTGQEEFIGTAANSYEPLNHFGAGDIPMTKAMYDVASAPSKMLHIPFLVGPIAVFHSVPSDELPADGIKLDSCLLSKILRRVITTWDDPAIKDLNPDLKVPAGQPISVAHRNLGSSSTAGITKYLVKATEKNSDATCLWDRENAGSSVTWETGTVPVFGSGGMADHLDATDYAIGYLDAGHGHTLGLEEIALQNRERYLKSKDADIPATIAAGLDLGTFPSNADSSFDKVDFLDMAGENSWPITMMSYFYVRKNLTSIGSAGPLLKAFIEFVLSKDGQDMVPEFAFAKLPQDLIEYNKVALAALVLDASESTWMMEGSKTIPYVGAGELVLSSKRQSYAEYDRDLLRTQLVALEALVKTLQVDVESGSRTDGSGVAAAVVALIISIIALILTGILWYKSLSSGHGSAGACLACAACRKPEGILASQYHIRLDNEEGAMNGNGMATNVDGGSNNI